MPIPPKVFKRGRGHHRAFSSMAQNTVSNIVSGTVPGGAEGTQMGQFEGSLLSRLLTTVQEDLVPG